VIRLSLKTTNPASGTATATAGFVSSNPAPDGFTKPEPGTALIFDGLPGAMFACIPLLQHCKQ